MTSQTAYVKQKRVISKKLYSHALPMETAESSSTALQSPWHLGSQNQRKGCDNCSWYCKCFQRFFLSALDQTWLPSSLTWEQMPYNYSRVPCDSLEMGFPSVRWLVWMLANCWSNLRAERPLAMTTTLAIYSGWLPTRSPPVLLSLSTNPSEKASLSKSGRRRGDWRPSFKKDLS